MSIWVKYSILCKHTDKVFAKDHECLLPEWADRPSNGVLAAERACSDHFMHEGWSEFFGEEEEADVIVQIAEPESIAGSYDVTMKRTVQATAQRAA